MYAGTYCAYPQRDGQAELIALFTITIWMWLLTMITDDKKLLLNLTCNKNLKNTHQNHYHLLSYTSQLQLFILYSYSNYFKNWKSVLFQKISINQN